MPETFSLSETVRIQLPMGFTPITSAPTRGYGQVYEVIFAPDEDQTHYEIGVGRYDSDRSEGARWRTVDNDAFADYDRDVIAYRLQLDEMKVIRLPEDPADVSEPSDRSLYDRAIAILAKEHAAALKRGDEDCRPKGVETVCEMFGVSVGRVVMDYRKANRDEREASRD